MPYNIGEKGSHGCSGYPVVKTATGEVMGCHPSQDDAMKQLAALHINEPDTMKVAGDGTLTNSGINPSSTANPNYPGVGIKYPDVNPRGSRKPRKNRKTRRGISPDANNSVGAFASGGPGGSMGMKNDDIDIWSGSAFEKKDYSTHARERMATSGEAMPDGSYPIANKKDLMNAIRSWGRGGADPKVKAHIISRARALDASDMIPENWK